MINFIVVFNSSIVELCPVTSKTVYTVQIHFNARLMHLVNIVLVNKGKIPVLCYFYRFSFVVGFSKKIDFIRFKHIYHAKIQGVMKKWTRDEIDTK